MSAGTNDEWRTLRERAIDYNRYAEILARDLEWQGALEQAHLSVELVMKAAIAKAGFDKYPTSASKGHDLSEIAKCRIDGRRSLHRAFQASRPMKPIWDTVISTAAWKMQNRYERLALDAISMEDSVDNYGRIYGWILRTFVDV